MLTQEKATALSEFLNADNDRAAKLVKMSADDAVKAMKAEGLEITAEELAEFGELAEKNVKSASGELDEAALEGVSGGLNSRPIITWPLIRPIVPINPFPIGWPIWRFKTK